MPVHGIVVVGTRAQYVCSPLSGVPVIVRSVRVLSGVPDIARVDVLCCGSEHSAVVAACSGLPVRVHADITTLLGDVGIGAHGGQRSGTAEGDGVLVVHDALRPSAPPGIGTAVIDAVRAGHRAVVPVLPLSDTVKQVDADGRPTSTPDRAGLRVVQTPQAFAAHLTADVLRAAAADPVRAWTGAGGIVHTVPGDPLAFAVHGDWDLEMAAAALGETR